MSNEHEKSVLEQIRAEIEQISPTMPLYGYDAIIGTRYKLGADVKAEILNIIDRYIKELKMTEKELKSEIYEYMKEHSISELFEIVQICVESIESESDNNEVQQ